MNSCKERFGQKLISKLDPCVERRRRSKVQRTFLEKTTRSFNAVQARCQSRLQKWAHPEARLLLEWQFDSDKSVNLSNRRLKPLWGRGHSFVNFHARTWSAEIFIVALLQEWLATMPEAARTVFGFRRAELYQHPPQAQHLANLLLTLSKENAQVIVATHSPYFCRVGLLSAFVCWPHTARGTPVYKLNDGQGVDSYCAKSW